MIGSIFLNSQTLEEFKQWGWSEPEALRYSVGTYISHQIKRKQREQWKLNHQRGEMAAYLDLQGSVPDSGGDLIYG